MTFLDTNERTEKIRQLLRSFRDNPAAAYRKWALRNVLELASIANIPGVSRVQSIVLVKFYCENMDVRNIASLLMRTIPDVHEHQADALESIFQYYLGEPCDRRKKVKIYRPTFNGRSEDGHDADIQALQKASVKENTQLVGPNNRDEEVLAVCAWEDMPSIHVSVYEMWRRHDAVRGIIMRREIVKTLLLAYPVDAMSEINDADKEILKAYYLEGRQLSAIAIDHNCRQSWMAAQKDRARERYRRAMLGHDTRSRSPHKNQPDKDADRQGEVNRVAQYVKPDLDEQATALHLYLADRTNKRLRDACIVAHLPLVRSYARKHHSAIRHKCEYEYEDIFEMGVEGLTDATDRFKPSKGKFSSYAMYYVKGYIFRYTEKDGGKRAALRKKEDLEEIAKCRPLTSEERDLYEQIELYLGAISYDQEVHFSGFGDGKETALLDMIPVATLSVEEQVEQNLALENTERALMQLSYEQQYVVRRHIFEEIGFNAIAQELGMAPQTARNRYTMAIKNLQEVLVCQDDGESEGQSESRKKGGRVEKKITEAERLFAEIKKNLPKDASEFWQLYDRQSSYVVKRLLLREIAIERLEAIHVEIQPRDEAVFLLYVFGRTDREILELFSFTSTAPVYNAKQAVINTLRRAMLGQAH